MADFRTHLIVGTAASGIGAGALLSIGLLSAAHAPACFALGAIGALLPDVDLDHSIPARVAFSLVALAGAFALVLALAPRWSLAELALAGAAAWVVLRHGVFGTINRWTVHRGLVHSLPAAAAFALATVLAAQRLYGLPVEAAWLAGGFLGAGFVVHLLLDEIYSVDLLGRRLKRSFGTALSFGDPRNLPGTLALYALAGGLYWLCPPAGGLGQRLLDAGLYRQLGARLLPAHGWFEGLPGLALEGLRRLL